MATQSLTGTVNRTDSTESTSWEELVGPGFDFETTETCKIMVQFFSFARLSDEEGSLHLRATVDGRAVFPGAMFFSGTRNTTLSYSGVLSNVRRGIHTVRMQWKVTRGTAWLSRRICTVWLISG